MKIIRGLFRDHDFRRFWLADTLSQVGTRVSALALPLLAVLVLDASAFEVSLLKTLQTVAFLLVGLQVGAWCDRWRCRPVMVVADLGRAVALGSIPLAAVFGVLTMAHLFAAVFTAGVFTVFFDVAHQSYLPRLVDKEHLVEGNAKLRASMSAAAIAAPGLAGGLVQWVGAPVAVLLDALSYLWSAIWLRSIKRVEPPPPPGRTMRADIAEGLRFVLRHPVLRATSAANATLGLFQSAHLAIVVVFLVRDVGLSAGLIGLLSTLGVVGALAAALVARKAADRIGAARLLWISAVANGCFQLLFPLTGPGWRLTFYLVALFGTAVAITLYTVMHASVQQALCPTPLLGRMNATSNFLFWGAAALGSTLAGITATLLGLRPTLWLAATGVLLSATWLVLSPLRTLRAITPPESDTETPSA
ncbi:MFS family permease [Actinokineospora baliensis]|uniref:MFS transporter n=1 Tax=Actinokineospora baliensis TaxID=547056 RepID=UPI0027DCEC83|nr:MFS transporter [Actinokineospora baliensis]MBM7774953.1 MFS family permease [Actinokineospora baliensis]